MSEHEKKEPLRKKLGKTRISLLTELAGLDGKAWNTAVYSEESTWTIVDLLRHLTGAESSMTKLMILIRDGQKGVPENFDLNYWNRRVVEKSKEKPPAALLAEMADNRISLYQFIDSLAEADWHKEGRHGSMRMLSIEQICHLIAEHEQTHLADIQKVISG